MGDRACAPGHGSKVGTSAVGQRWARCICFHGPKAPQGHAACFGGLWSWEGRPPGTRCLIPVPRRRGGEGASEASSTTFSGRAERGRLKLPRYLNKQCLTRHRGSAFRHPAPLLSLCVPHITWVQPGGHSLQQPRKLHGDSPTLHHSNELPPHGR